MNKEISVLVNVYEPSTTTNFDVASATDYEIFLAMTHLAVLLQDRNLNLEDVFDDILESLDSAEELEEEFNPEMLN